MPMPAPQVVMDALTELSVTVNDVGHSGFQLSFTAEQSSPLHTLFLLTGGSSDHRSCAWSSSSRQRHAERADGRRDDQSPGRARAATAATRR